MKLNDTAFGSVIDELVASVANVDIVIGCVPNLTVESTETNDMFSVAVPLNGEAGVAESNVTTPGASTLETVKSTKSAEDNVNVVLLFASVKSSGVDKSKAETMTTDNTKATTAKIEINDLLMLMCCNSLITMVFKYFYCGVSRYFSSLKGFKYI